MATLRRIIVFVDWDTARRVVASRRAVDCRHIERVFEYLRSSVANYLHALDGTTHYRVNWRIYHGWFSGKTKTIDRILIESYIYSCSSTTIKKISFGSNFALSDILSFPSKRYPIYDTLRTDRDTLTTGQKMVDSSLICDLLHLVRSKSADAYIMIANDDDFIPALYAGESWGARVVLLHTRSSLNPHLNLTGLTERMRPE